MSTLLKTPSGDVSSRRIAATGYLVTSLGLAVASIWNEISFDIFVTTVIACLTALGLTVPDQFNTIKKT